MSYPKHEVEPGIRHACLSAGVSIGDLARRLGIHPRALFNYRSFPRELSPDNRASLEAICNALFELGNLSLRFEPDDLLATWGPLRNGGQHG